MTAVGSVATVKTQIRRSVLNAVLKMQSGNEFVARPYAVGTTEDELRAMVRGTVPSARVKELQDEMLRAAFTLNAIAPQSRC